MLNELLAGLGSRGIVIGVIASASFAKSISGLGPAPLCPIIECEVAASGGLVGTRPRVRPADACR